VAAPRAHLLELLLLARRDVDLGAVLYVRRGNHRANAGPAAGDHSYLHRQRCVRSSGRFVCAPVFPFTLKSLGMVKSRQHLGQRMLKGRVPLNRC
jgi:hypothetical protein